MNYTNYQTVPVCASDGHPLMPCHPARARKLLADGRAVLHHRKVELVARRPGLSITWVAPSQQSHNIGDSPNT